MKNITVSVGDNIYHRARVRAAEQRTSVSAIVRRILSDVASEETGEERLRRLEEETVKSIDAREAAFRAGDRLSREEVHKRDAVS